MKKNKVPYIVGASSLALILLFVIQVKWMLQSERLIEEQFDQKVSMALCRAVDDVSNNESSKIAVQKCNATNGNCNDLMDNFLNSVNIREEVSRALAFYKIDMPYEISVAESSQAKKVNDCKPALKQEYSCSLNPIMKNDELELSLNFIGKKAYVRKEMGLMLVLSILILLFISSVFVYANLYLIKQKRLSERNKEFFNHMAHEFKTPLTNIGLASKMLMKRKDDPLINIIHTENKQLSEQVENVLSMASIESGQFAIRKEYTNLLLLISEVLKSMKMQLLDKNGNIELRGIDDSFYILADQFHMANVLRNILENAIKYNDEDPDIHIIGKEKDGNIIISIQDNGIGIAPENQDLIFEKFFRLQKTENSSNRGFGLGLSYVKKIIKLHDGNVKIFSEWKKGSRFDIQVPKAIQI